MKPAAVQQPVVNSVRVNDGLITFVLLDGRELSIPTAWSRRLTSATQTQRNHYKILPDGFVVTWPDVDEHIGVWTFLGVDEGSVLDKRETSDERGLVASTPATTFEPFSAIPDDPDCTHRVISSYQRRNDGQPVAFWTCARCGRPIHPEAAHTMMAVGTTDTPQTDHRSVTRGLSLRPPWQEARVRGLDVTRPSPSVGPVALGIPTPLGEPSIFVCAPHRTIRSDGRRFDRDRSFRLRRLAADLRHDRANLIKQDSQIKPGRDDGRWIAGRVLEEQLVGSTALYLRCTVRTHEPDVDLGFLAQDTSISEHELDVAGTVGLVPGSVVNERAGGIEDAVLVDIRQVGKQHQPLASSVIVVRLHLLDQRLDRSRNALQIILRSVLVPLLVTNDRKLGSITGVCLGDAVDGMVQRRPQIANEIAQDHSEAPRQLAPELRDGLERRRRHGQPDRLNRLVGFSAMLGLDALNFGFGEHTDFLVKGVQVLDGSSEV